MFTEAWNGSCDLRVIERPKKNYKKIKTDIATTRPKRPKGQIGEKYFAAKNAFESKIPN